MLKKARLALKTVGTLFEFAKWPVKWLLFHLGFLGLLLTLIKLLSGKRIGVILTYHLVRKNRDTEDAFPGLETGVDAETFARQVSFLKKRFNVCSISELVDAVSTVDGKKGAFLAFSFDDAYRAVFENVLPVLRANSVPATVFVPLSFVNTDRAFWWLTVSEVFRRLTTAEYMILKKELLQRFGDEVMANIRLPSDIESRDNRHSARLQLTVYIGDATEARRLALMEVVGRHLHSKVDEHKLVVTTAQLSAMAQSRVEIASHTLSHRDLVSLTLSEIDEELSGSKRELEEKLTVPVRGVAYPYGRFNDSVLESTLIAGYEWGVITQPGIVRDATDRFRLPRIPGDHDLPSVTVAIIKELIRGRRNAGDQ